MDLLVENPYLMSSTSAKGQLYLNSIFTSNAIVTNGVI